jgi:hypothetical protein
LFKNLLLSSGERDLRCFLCAAALVFKILHFFLGGRDSRYSCVHQYFGITFELYPQVKEIVDIFVVQRHV